ncbi:unnamed protein product [Spirodela intermedia]|uniref:Uncharacterized protein n=1 Tax=Spirodela intermedia TaxID=51605 RepID=A0A7I8J535_SPIIN|nr:unnamed protein product [Spirodela intermedia]CAA6664491.1 unnamed protein product [Spirodela intermedia]
MFDWFNDFLSAKILLLNTFHWSLFSPFTVDGLF